MRWFVGWPMMEMEMEMEIHHKTIGSIISIATLASLDMEINLFNR